MLTLNVSYCVSLFVFTVSHARVSLINVFNCPVSISLF